MFIEPVRAVCRTLGIEIKRYRPGNSYWASLQRMLVQHDIDLVLDVGANSGQFSGTLRKTGYKRRIVSFEPLLGAYQQLLTNSAKDPLWKIAPRMAIGDIDGEIAINVSANSVSSSIAHMLRTHLEAAPESRYIGKENVLISRLDTVAKTFVPAASRTFLKIDTQGYEPQVLAGASQLIPLLKGLQLELSLVPLYEGGGVFIDTVRSLNEMGFELYGLFDAFSHQETGRMLQVDGVFFRCEDSRREHTVGSRGDAM